ncbi:MAG: hypothetical protein AMS27_17110 [Bacteroides sp. SM23_62_1]|nr:MAG: hypothetical protein AMS27_17110 [Bacteroides sp. SM23_62_1]
MFFLVRIAIVAEIILVTQHKKNRIANHGLMFAQLCLEVISDNNIPEEKQKRCKNNPDKVYWRIPGESFCIS